MILVLEHDRRFGFWWRPRVWTFWWGYGRSRRLAWGWWSISTYPAPGLKEFFDYVREGNTEWKD